jgi:hypothetical protein
MASMFRQTYTQYKAKHLRDAKERGDDSLCLKVIKNQDGSLTLLSKTLHITVRRRQSTV